MNDREINAAAREFIDVDGMSKAEALELARASVNVNPWPAMAARVPVMLAALAQYEQYKVVPSATRAGLVALASLSRDQITLVSLADVIERTDWFMAQVARLSADPFYQMVAAGEMPKTGRWHGLASYRAGVVAFSQVGGGSPWQMAVRGDHA